MQGTVLEDHRQRCPSQPRPQAEASQEDRRVEEVYGALAGEQKEARRREKTLLLQLNSQQEAFCEHPLMEHHARLSFY